MHRSIYHGWYKCMQQISNAPTCLPPTPTGSTNRSRTVINDGRPVWVGRRPVLVDVHFCSGSTKWRHSLSYVRGYVRLQNASRTDDLLRNHRPNDSCVAVATIYWGSWVCNVHHVFKLRGLKVRPVLSGWFSYQRPQNLLSSNHFTSKAHHALVSESLFSLNFTYGTCVQIHFFMLLLYQVWH